MRPLTQSAPRLALLLTMLALAPSAVPQEPAPADTPADPARRAADQGTLLANARFEQWQDNAPLSWIWKADAGAMLSPREDGSPGAKLVVSPESEARLSQFLSNPAVLPGDQVLLVARLHCQDPADVQLVARLYDAASKELARADARPIANGQIELRAMLRVPETPAAQLNVGIFVPRRTNAEAAIITLFELQAEIIPALP